MIILDPPRLNIACFIGVSNAMGNNVVLIGPEDVRGIVVAVGNFFKPLQLL